MSMKATKPTIYAYGFDKYGFSLPSQSIERDDFIVRFIAYESDLSLDSADGLVIPSGIFEQYHRVKDIFGEPAGRDVRYDKALLAAREKQLFNAFQRGIWTAFLLGAVDNGESENWKETDLAKKFLNMFTDRVVTHDPVPYVNCKASEFRIYLDRFGIAQTQFSVKDGLQTSKILAHVSEAAVAFETGGQFFFLPFFTTKRDGKELVDALSLTVGSILEYKRKNDIYLPAWVSKLQFKAEAKIRLEVQKVERQLVKLTEEVGKWEKYKAILCTSGSNLNTIVVEVLRDFFGLDLKSEEKYIEDAVIYDHTGKPIFVVEIKGVNGGIKREQINQVDSHRERLGFGSDIPGLLVINDFMDVENFDERKAKSFDPQNLTHARNNNVKILRTVTLFEMMLALEDATDRKDPLLTACETATPLLKVP